MKYREVRKKLLDEGFVEHKGRGKGDHRLYIHPDGRRTTLDYGGGGKDVPKGTLGAIKRQTGVDF